MPISPPRCRRQANRIISAALIRGPGVRGADLAVAAVEGEEDLFQAGLVAGDADDLAVAERLHQRLEAAPHVAADRMIADLDLIDPRSRPDRLDRNGSAKLDLDLPEADVVQLGEPGGSNQPA